MYGLIKVPILYVNYTFQCPWKNSQGKATTSSFRCHQNRGQQHSGRTQKIPATEKTIMNELLTAKAFVYIICRFLA